jgi:hypothetical protein
MISVHAQLLASESLHLQSVVGAAPPPLPYQTEPPKEPLAPLGNQGGKDVSLGGAGRRRRCRSRPEALLVELGELLVAGLGYRPTLRVRLPRPSWPS